MGRGAVATGVALAGLCLASGGFVQPGARPLAGFVRSRHLPHGRPRKSAQSRRRGVTVAVFSGIIEQMGRVAEVVPDQEMTLWSGEKGRGMGLTIKDAKVVLDGAYEGCSIAVNGVCLTVVTFSEDVFTVGCAPETIRRTNLGDLKEGNPVNLERSLPADGRNSGHMVQGHVDATGTILDKWMEGDSLWVKVSAPPDLLPYIVSKGYIAVDGTSLTVCDVDRQEASFTFMLIPYTQEHIIVPRKEVGDRVNLEVDVIAKYVEWSVGPVIQDLREEVLSLQKRVSDLEAAAAATAAAVVSEARE